MKPAAFADESHLSNEKKKLKMIIMFWPETTRKMVHPLLEIGLPEEIWG